MPVLIGILAAASIALILLVWRLWWMQVYGDGILWVIHRGHKELTKVKCLTCNGLGLMWLHNGESRVIPANLRNRQKGRWTSAPKLANARTCRQCNGQGFNWRAAT